MDFKKQPSETSTDYFENLKKHPATPRFGIVTVKFTTDDGKTFTQAYTDDTTICEIKNHLHEIFAVKPTNINISNDDYDEIPDEKKLYDFRMGPFATLEFGLRSDDISKKIAVEDAYKDMVVPDIITVRVPCDDNENEFKEIVIEIEDRSVAKPFVGGYVNTRTCVEYHNGWTQTGPRQPRVVPGMTFHRDTQTYWLRNRKVETTYERATQMSNEETWIPNVNDKVLTAGPYETADEMEERLGVLQKVITIQRYFRAWKLRKALKVLSEEYKKRLRKEQEVEEYNRKAEEDHKKRELIGKVFPRTKTDFAMLYAMVDRWKRAEIQRISNTYCGAAKITQFYMLLDKEIEMLRSIEDHRIQVKKEMEEQKFVEFFKEISTPLEWNSDYKNLRIQMDTLETQRGREFYEIFKSFADTSADREDRIQGLLNVKLLLHDHNCIVAMELVSLIDRACELLVRGLNDRHLSALLKRIEALFIHHLDIPECSEGVTNRMKRVKEKLMENNLFYCVHCKKVKTHEQFVIHSRLKKLRVCQTCSWNDKTREPWVDLAPARFMLQTIRREEHIKKARSSIAFILQDRDIHHIIHNIWHAKSVVSEADDIYDLRLVRFFQDQDWSPWNCILLTKREAKIHGRIHDLCEVYDDEIFFRVYNFHVLARNHFQQAIKLDEHDERIGVFNAKWDELIESQKFVPVNSKTKIFLSCH